MEEEPPPYNARRMHVTESCCWCPLNEPVTKPLLAVIGVLSVDNRWGLRNAARKSWLGNAAAVDMEVRFILRGIGIGKQTIAEAEAQRDILFVHANSNATWPLQSMLRWFSCALASWPRANLIGKADDDIWASLPDIASSLRRSQAELVAAAASGGMYWGMMEDASWNTTSHLPHSFGGVRSAPCRHASLATGSVHGPFVFAKGPLYFLSAALVSRFLADASLMADGHAAAAVAPSATSHRRKPWEDVFTGYALSRLGVARVGVVDVPWSAVTEQWGFMAKPSALLYHMKRPKDPARILAMQAWASKHHCSAKLTNATCSRVPINRFERQYKPMRLRNCAPVRPASDAPRHGVHSRRGEAPPDARWLLCEAPRTSTPGVCSDALVDLKKYLKPKVRLERAA